MSVRLGKQSVRHELGDAAEEQLSSLITQVTNEINWYMTERKLTRADLAGRMGVSPGRISQVLSGGENLTLRTLVSIAVALDGQFDVELKPCKATQDAYAASHAHDDAPTPAI